jgi:hypothetical protein
MPFFPRCPECGDLTGSCDHMYYKPKKQQIPELIIPTESTEQIAPKIDDLYIQGFKDGGMTKKDEIDEVYKKGFNDGRATRKDILKLIKKLKKIIKLTIKLLKKYG